MRSRSFTKHSSVRVAFVSPGVRKVIIGLAALVLAALPFVARADDDLPGRVGRVAEFAGQLFLAPQDRATEWAPVGINYPITSGDNLWVSGDGRAEIDYGGGQFRFAGDTNLNVARLDDRQLALFIAQGRLIVRVRVLDAGDVTRIDTPNTQVTLTRPGLYRIDVLPDGQGTTVSVREGEALVALTSGAQQALPGQMLTVSGPEPAYADIRNGFGLDGFDSWSDGRDRHYESGGSSAYVSREMVGYAELDEYGIWENTPTYGPVWYPSAVAVDWTPYRYGYWTSVGSWGLTWVDSAPWGYAPSHYGRWVRVGPRWGWCPGAFVARPYWAPALVAWYGGGSWGMAGSAGAPVYGWVPLGWGDPYNPWWRSCSHNCWTHYNRPFAVNVAVRPTAPPARYSHASVPGAMTAVAAPNLGSRQPVATSMVPLPLSLARSAPILATAPAVPPTPSHLPGFRPGERGTPAPASTSYSRTWPGRNAAAQTPGPSALPGAPSATGTVAPRTGAGPSGVPSTFAPAARPAPGGLSPVVPPSATKPPQVVAPAPDARRSAPAAPTPGAGGTVVPVPPPRSDGTPQIQHPRPPGQPGSSPPGSLPPQTPGRTPNTPAGGQATGAPPAGSQATGGLSAPPSRPVPPPAAPGRVAPTPSLGQPPVAQGRVAPTPSLGQPPAAPSRVAPTPSLGQPVSPPAAVPAPAAPVRQQPAQAKPADVDKNSPGPVPR